MTATEFQLRAELRRKVFNALEEIGEEHPELDDELLKDMMEEATKNFFIDYFGL